MTVKTQFQGLYENENIIADKLLELFSDKHEEVTAHVISKDTDLVEVHFKKGKWFYPYCFSTHSIDNDFVRLAVNEVITELDKSINASIG